MVKHIKALLNLAGGQIEQSHCGTFPCIEWAFQMVSLISPTSYTSVLVCISTWPRYYFAMHLYCKVLPSWQDFTLLIRRPILVMRRAWLFHIPFGGKYMTVITWRTLVIIASFHPPRNLEFHTCMGWFSCTVRASSSKWEPEPCLLYADAL